MELWVKGADALHPGKFQIDYLLRAPWFIHTTEKHCQPDLIKVQVFLSFTCIKVCRMHFLCVWITLPLSKKHLSLDDILWRNDTKGFLSHKWWFSSADPGFSVEGPVQRTSRVVGSVLEEAMYMKSNCYRPQGKVMFSEACVILFTIGLVATRSLLTGMLSCLT